MCILKLLMLADLKWQTNSHHKPRSKQIIKQGVITPNAQDAVLCDLLSTAIFTSHTELSLSRQTLQDGDAEAESHNIVFVR